MINEILEYNKEFVETKKYKSFITSKYPDKKIAVVSCMDTRLTELLPAALGLKNGDAKFIKNAGGVISHPFGSVMRSLLIAVYDLDVSEILVIGHTDCGARHTDGKKMIEKMKIQGVLEEDIEWTEYCGVNLNSWLSGFEDLNYSIKKSVDIIRKHPLIPKGVAIYGMIIDSVTGKLTTVG